MALPPMISTKSLGSMPDFVRQELGTRHLDRAFATSKLPHAFIERRDGYIPKKALADFVAEVGRGFGERNIGLLWAPTLDVLDYDAWGRHVLSAPTLGTALERARHIMPFHSSTDRTAFRTDGDLIRYAYRFGLPDHKAYPDIAFSALGSVLSIFRHYLGVNWRPVRICCDMPPVVLADDVELAFGCPVSWKARRLEICVNRGELAARPSNPLPKVTTLEDLRRERASELPRTFSDCVARAIQLQIANGVAPSVDATARALGLGTRSLQRRLERDGLTFRVLSIRIRIERAKELLRHGGMMVGEIATELGYENPNNFARAFKNMTGVSPTRFPGANHTPD